MKKMQAGFTAPELMVVILGVAALLGVGGWIANIVKLVHSDLGQVTGMLVARAIGVVLAPLGAVLGFV